MPHLGIILHVHMIINMAVLNFKRDRQIYKENSEANADIFSQNRVFLTFVCSMLNYNMSNLFPRTPIRCEPLFVL